jgi:hypothetical protein
MMVNNSTKINKINSHLKSLNTKKNETFADGNPCPGLGQEQNMSGLNPSTESLPLFIILLLQTRFYNSVWFLYYLIITNQIL